MTTRASGQRQNRSGKCLLIRFQVTCCPDTTWIELENFLQCYFIKRKRRVVSLEEVKILLKVYLI